MLPQIDNRIISSFVLYVDHEIQRQGQSFVNYHGLFFPANSKVNGLTVYTCPYKQLCNDTSISGAEIMSGVYINGNYVSVGQSGLTAINHYDGALYFTNSLPSNSVISGNFAVKDVAIYLSDQPDYKLLFDSKFETNPRYSNQISGVALDAKIAPAVFLVPKIQENRPFAFAGLDDNYNLIRAVVIADSVFQRVAIANILKNFRLKPLKVVSSSPLDYLGNMTGINYNYNDLPGSSYYFPIILGAKSTVLSQIGTSMDVRKQVSFVDFDISTWAGHA